MWKTIDKEIINIFLIREWKFNKGNANDFANPVLTFKGKKYLINELSNEIKESIKKHYK